jgi:hypothetical protein
MEYFPIVVQVEDIRLERLRFQKAKETAMRSPMIQGKQHFGPVLCLILALAICPTAVHPESSAVTRDRVTGYADAITVAGVLERYAQACGGQALAEVKSEKRKGTLVRGLSGQVPFEMVSKAQGKWLYNQVFSYGDQVSYGCDGTTAWIQDTKGVDTLTGVIRMDLELLMDVHLPLRLREYFSEISLKGSEKRDGRDLDVFLAKTRDGREVELAFDAESGLMTKAGDLSFEDYRAVEKVRRPYRVSIGDDPGGLALRLKMEFTEFTQNSPVPDSAFGRPSCPLPVKVSPLYKPRLYVKVSDEALQACVGVYRHPKIPGVTYTVTRQQNHLMIERTGWGQAFEFKPESDLDYSIRFMNIEFHFVRDSSGRVAAVEIGSERAVRAERIK